MSDSHVLRTRPGARAVPRQSGATMIEVLVALFVLSVGLLGVAAMQQVSLRNSVSSQSRAQATALAYEIIDRMRANRARAILNPSPYTIALGDARAAAVCPTAAPGSTAEQVDCDLRRWKEALAAALPAGDGSIAVAAPPVPGPVQARVVTVIVEWGDRQDDGGVGTLQFRTETQL